MRELGIRGLGVTMPFKEQVIPFLDALDDMSREIGAVNTIVNDSGRLTGYNTTSTARSQRSRRPRRSRAGASSCWARAARPRRWCGR